MQVNSSCKNKLQTKLRLSCSSRSSRSYFSHAYKFFSSYSYPYLISSQGSLFACGLFGANNASIETHKFVYNFAMKNQGRIV